MGRTYRNDPDNPSSHVRRGRIKKSNKRKNKRGSSEFTPKDNYNVSEDRYPDEDFEKFSRRKKNK